MNSCITWEIAQQRYQNRKTDIEVSIIPASCTHEVPHHSPKHSYNSLLAQELCLQDGYQNGIQQHD